MKNTTYTSEATQFINTLLAEPEVRQQQKELRATWWDKNFIDLDEQKSYDQADVKQDAYVYFTYPSESK